MARKTSARETTIQQEEGGKVESRYECPICLNWLKDPILTSCGHRFCKDCINEWFKKNQYFCPIDNKALTEKDLFLDLCTSREINQIKKPCPNVVNGCTENICPIDIDAHLVKCVYRREAIAGSQDRIQCPFNKYGCSFQTNDAAQLDTHSQVDMHKHLDMLLVAFTQAKSIELKSIEATNLWDPPSKTQQRQNGNNVSIHVDNKRENKEVVDTAQNCSTTASSTRNNYYNDLLRGLYERIVALEQLSREQKIQIENLTTKVNKNAMAMNSRYSGGMLIWKITQFNHRVTEMSSNPNNMYYSPDVYTGPHGYRFCARINISPKAKDSISLHVHMMQSDNDCHLDWPFRGCIEIWMLNQNPMNTQHDKIMSNEKILAFQRPEQEISVRGFGFIEYANIKSIQTGGFLTMDETLIIKIHFSIV